MNEKNITTEFIQNSNGFMIAESDLTTGKVVINNIEITSVEDWNKVTHSILELQQENSRLKDNYKQLKKFICCEQDRLLKATSHTYQDSFDRIKFVNSDIFEELKKVENKLEELLKEN